MSNNRPDEWWHELNVDQTVIAWRYSMRSSRNAPLDDGVDYPIIGDDNNDDELILLQNDVTESLDSDGEADVTADNEDEEVSALALK